jgi:hypothetical protein
MINEQISVKLRTIAVIRYPKLTKRKIVRTELEMAVFKLNLGKEVQRFSW